MSELAHGLLLQEQGRLEEAEACFQQVLMQEPENDFVYGRLALCQLNQEGKKKASLRSVEEAIRIRPDGSFYHALKSLVLADLCKGKESLVSADTALALAPEDGFVLAAKANAFCSLQRWAEGEEWSRKALTADGEHPMATNLLAHCLRMQGKGEENREAVGRLLAADPESILAHVNAGWSALQHGEQEQAESHFREALRIDPELDMAREGLIESFRARSIFYRAYLSYVFFLQRFTQGRKWMILIGIIVIYQVSWRLLERVHPMAAVGVGLLFLTLVMWIWLAPGVGNFLILMDRSARLALRPREKGQGIAVGGAVVVGLVLVTVGVFAEILPAIFSGGCLIASAVPASLSWGNESRAGRRVFGSITGVLYGLAVILPLLLMGQKVTSEDDLPPLVAPISLFGLLLVVASTWLGNLQSLRTPTEE
ncbi:MAG: tetratricopeptide repeat protein [Verrucomicrobiales bacterium]|nr:tetratricopeptide repeat protein [Verrucomicrobiales bacterium]